jgi:predicted anti-sigma-YlaC factor YlaD
MTCGDARVALLEADLADLRGETDSVLALHLRGCPACREAAVAILAVEAAAGRRIADPSPRRDAAEAMALGRAAARRRRYGRMAWLAPLAAAAGVVALITTRPARLPPGRDRAAAIQPPHPSRVAVEAPAGQNVAVFETADADIVVIWLF